MTVQELIELLETCLDKDAQVLTYDDVLKAYINKPLVISDLEDQTIKLI